MSSRMVIVVIAVACALVGCQRSPKEEDADWVLRELKGIRERANSLSSVPLRAGERANLAISLRTNDVVDATPIVIDANLMHPMTRESALVIMRMCTYDEDGDASGIGVQETRVGEDGVKKVLVEEYPAFIHWPPCDALALRRVPVQIRTADERKDDAQWQRYMTGEGIDLARLRTDQTYYDATCPPLYVSLPEPNTVNVQVYVYDRAGNKSKPIPLVCEQAD